MVETVKSRVFAPGKFYQASHYSECRYVLYHYAKCRHGVSLCLMSICLVSLLLIVIILSVIKHSVSMLSGIIFWSNPKFLALEWNDLRPVAPL